MNKLLLAFLMTVSFNANAIFNTGNDLLMACDATSETDTNSALKNVLCMGYIAGMIDAIQITFGQYPEIRSFCLPTNGMSINQQVMVVTKYLRENPNQLHETARSSVFIALAKDFPCA